MGNCFLQLMREMFKYFETSFELSKIRKIIESNSETNALQYCLLTMYKAK